MKTVSEQMELARKAQAIVNDYTHEQIDEICLAIGWEIYEDENIARLAKMAVEETGYGNVRAKIIIKHKRKVGGVLHDIKGAKSVGLIERNEETGISNTPSPWAWSAPHPPDEPHRHVRQQQGHGASSKACRHLQAQFPRAEKHHRGHQHDARRPAGSEPPKTSFRCLKIRAAKPSPNS